MKDYKLEELARAADIAARTVRYYVQRGLLPAPAFRGKDTTYGEDHLLRLRAIKCLQQAHLPLDVIQSRIASASPAELEAITSGRSARRVPLESARPPRREAPDAEVWERFEIAPGLELHVKKDAAAKVHRAANEILNSYRKYE